MHPNLKSSAPLLLLIALTALIGYLYGLALPGFLLFDDTANLRQLALVDDWTSGLGFVASGTAGPLGRPIALATFALQADAWPRDTAALLRVNVAIHLAAVVAVFVLAWGMARVRGTLPGDPACRWIALGVAALWGLSPFLATANLTIVQRMTGLSGLFVLAGLAAFVWAHALAKDRERLSVALLALGLGLGTLLATLSKENGALLPLLALVVLYLWIPSERRLTGTWTRRTIWVLALLPAAALLAYLFLVELPAILGHGYGGRYFTPLQRLMAEPAILLDYLTNLLLPRVDAVTPFMDRYPAPDGWLSPPITLLAPLVWLLLVAVSVGLRRRAPYLLLGVGFFLVGHLLESSFLGLELYFAHRNYVPAFGIYFALVFALASVPHQTGRLAVAGGALYGVLTALALAQAAAAWSQPRLSAERWLARNPDSERGAQFFANLLVQEGRLARAQRVLDTAADRHPRTPYLQLQRVQICLSDADRSARLLRAAERLRRADFEPVVADELMAWTQRNPSGLCPGLTYADLERLAGALLENPPYRRSRMTRAKLIAAQGLAAIKEGRGPEGIAQLTESFALNPSIEIALFTAEAMYRADRRADMEDFLRRVMEAAPSDPLERAKWSGRIQDFREALGLAQADRHPKP